MSDLRSAWTNRPARRPGRAALVAALTVVVGACDGAGHTGIRVVGAAIVYGQVSDAAGVPLSGVLVKAVAYRTECGVGHDIGSGPPAVTDAEGAFRLQIVSEHPSEQACVQPTVARTVGGDFEPVGEGARVYFKEMRTQSLPYDSVRFDLQVER